MKRVKLNALVILLITTGSVLLMNCKGDDGAIGPKGEDGNANVFYSDWVSATNIKDSTSDNSLVKVGHIAAPAITDDILNKGMVYVYMSFGSSVNQLPYISNAGGKVNTISFWIKAGQVIPYRFTHDNSNSIVLASSLRYRYIVIPANTPINPSGRTAAPDYSDYEAVCRYYSIPL